MDLTGSVALVTGGSGDLGTAIAKALAAAGADVAITYVGNTDGAAATCGAIERLGRRSRSVQLDLTRPDANDRVADEIAARMGRLDILVNNAAWNVGIPFVDLDALTTDVWDRTYRTNLRGPFELARAAARHMNRQKGGRVVNIASVAGLRPVGSSIAYACSKAALIHLTRCLAVALAPDITVNCIAPGLVEGTRMAARISPAVVEVARRSAVLLRAASRYDIARPVATSSHADSVPGPVPH